MSPSVRLLVDLRHICTLHIINTTGASSVWASTRPDMWKLCLMKQPQLELPVRVSAVLYYFPSSFFLTFCPISLYVFICSLFLVFLRPTPFLHSLILPSSFVSHRLSSFRPFSPFHFFLSTFLDFIRSFIIPLFL
jgi:hypothetical protein